MVIKNALKRALLFAEGELNAWIRSRLPVGRQARDAYGISLRLSNPSREPRRWLASLRFSLKIKTPIIGCFYFERGERGVSASLARRRELIRCPGIAQSIPRMLCDRSLRRRPADRRLAHCNPVRIPASLQEAK